MLSPRVAVAVVCLAAALTGCAGHPHLQQPSPSVGTLTTRLAADGLQVHILPAQAPPGVVPAIRAEQAARRMLPVGAHIDQSVLADIRNIATGHHGQCWLILASTPNSHPSRPPTSQLADEPSNGTLAIAVVDAPTGFLLYVLR